MTQKNALAFHSVTIKSGDNYNPPKAIHHAGFTAIEYAAIHTGQPCSGTPWLDEMIRAQRRERLAAQASEQDIRHHQEFKQYTTMYGGPDGPPIPKYSREQARYRYADALITELEGGAK